MVQVEELHVKPLKNLWDLSSKNHGEYDCTKDSSKIRYMSFHSGNMGNGKVIDAGNEGFMTASTAQHWPRMFYACAERKR